MITLSKIHLEDSATISTLVNLDQKYMQYPWNKEDRLCLNESSSCYDLYQIIYDKKPIGFTLLEVSFEDQFVHLLKVVVENDYRGQGFARQALEFLFNKYREKKICSIYLEASVSNSAAIKLYESLKFEVLVEKKRFYSDGSNAYAMQRIL